MRRREIESSPRSSLKSLTSLFNIFMKMKSPEYSFVRRDFLITAACKNRQNRALKLLSKSIVPIDLLKSLKAALMHHVEIHSRRQIYTSGVKYAYSLF